MKIVGVTGCPTGIAHSEMAAESLEEAAEELEHDITVEVNGSMGTENELTEEDIESAEVAIVAADISVDTDRLEGKPQIKVPVQDAVKNAESLIERAVTLAETGEDPGKDKDNESSEEGDKNQNREGFVSKLKKIFS